MKSRYAMTIAIPMIAVAYPALSATCNLTLNGRTVLDDASCTAAKRGRTVVVEQGGVLVARISGSYLAAVTDDPDSVSNRIGSRRIRSFGRIVKSNDLDEKTCYFNQHATLCVEE